MDLYADNIPAGITVTEPYYAYRHNERVVTGETCGTGSSAVSGIAFYTGSNYPAAYADGLVFSDSSRRCVWTMFAPPGGDPDKTDILALVSLADNRVVDVAMGPDGNIYYIEYHNSNGKVWRVEYTLTNDPPLVYITKPWDSTSFVVGSTVEFSGSASDTEDGDLTSALAWSSSIDSSIGSGGSFSLSNLSLGTHTITAEATDGDSDSGSDSIFVTIHEAPSVSITAPPDGHTAVQGDSVSFTGTANDTEDGDLTAAIEWSSSLDGAIGSGGSFSTSTLALGTHTITATVKDSEGAEANDTISVTITVNADPEVTLTSPADSSVFLEGTSISFSGTASDDEDGDLTASLNWNSTLDGDFGTGGSFSQVLSVGDHTVTASVTDSHGGTDSTSINLTINAPPTVSIAAPTSGHTVVEGTSVAFIASANDTEDGNLTASISWSSSINGAIGSGGSFSTSSLSVGTHTITAEVTDSHDETRDDSISVIINPNTAPNVAITAPANNSVFLEGTNITFSGTATDNEDGNISGNLVWTSSIDTGIGFGASFQAVLSVGVHTITALVTDSHGAPNSTVITVTVHEAPVVSRTGPGDGSLHQEGDSIVFSGSATDNEDGDLTTSLSWSSSVDGAIGSGGSFSTSALSAGAHTITASVTDSQGAEGSQDIAVTVNAQPSVAITTPANGFMEVEATSIGFSGTAADSEDGDIAANLSWESSRDGAIGLGGSFSSDTLSVGVHTITASVTDADGGSASDAITVTVTANTGPSVSITAPANGSTHQEGDSISFTGSANDTEDGDLTASLTWSSNIDGSIGSGGSFSISSLAAGTHTITASVTDSHGSDGSDAITLTVNAAPEVTITSPANGHSEVEGTSVNFVGTATDAEDGNIAGSLTWTSTIDGAIGAGASFSTTTLAVGTHTITASVDDSDGGSASDAITVTITANTGPDVSITAPANGFLSQQGDSISFTGSATDTEDGDLTSALAWSSSMDGSIGSGGSFSISTLAAGNHTITASVTDSHSTPGSAAINVTVNAPPVVAITAPANGHTVVEDTAINFTGTATDSEDGDIGSSLSWTSSLDGSIGSGATFSTALLSIGSHTITASVTDSDGGSHSDDITVIVNANTAPSVTIDTPADGSLYQLDDSISFTGSANDTEDGDLTSGLSWNSSIDGAIGSGGSFSTAGLSAGTHTITASATDSHGENGSLAISVTVNDPPTVTINAPANGHTVVEDTSIGFGADAVDLEDGDIAAGLSWTSNLDGSIGSGSSFSTVTLTVGTHTITASVTDSDGGSHSDDITVTVNANTAPMVTIDAPSDGSLYQLGDSVSFTGSANDTEDGDLTSGLSWTSSIDGAIGSGGSFSTTALSAGTHTVTAAATDSHEETCSSAVSVTINDPPVVTITGPSTGHTVVEGTSISFTGTAADTEDGNIGANLVWTSSLDGSIGNGGSFSTTALSVGTHTITASVTDGDGGQGSDGITVNINSNTGPSVTITAPLDSSLYQAGDSVSFAGSANDTEDGDLTAGLSWTSSIDGAIGSGAAFSTVLSAGSHTITAAVDDGHGETGSAAITVAVNAAPVVTINSPAGGSSVVEDTNLDFVGTATDSEDGEISANLSWESSRDGTIGSGGSFSTAALSVGTHTITASVTDSQGGTHSDSIFVTVNANSAPSVTITAPADGTVVDDGETIGFAGSANDSEDGDLTTSLGWTSSIDGSIGSGGSFSTGALSVGSHTITASVTDSHSETGSAAITVVVNAVPVVSVTGPVDGHSVVEDTSVSFTGTASDPEDGDLTASLSWTSSLDGGIGSGGAFSTANLSVGTHTITASASDSHGAAASDTIAVTVTSNTAPQASITSPADGSLYQEGASIAFGGAATDTEDGDLTGNLTWTSSLDGGIGAGGSFSTTALSAGVHSITASVTDSHDADGSDSITVTVNAAPLVAITTPANGHSVVEDTNIDFSGTATDSEDGDLAASLSWTSSWDGAIGSGGSFSTTTLTVGTHTITALVTDSDGGQHSDSIIVIINANSGPSVSITAPTDGSLYQAGDSVSFAGSANDTEDGDLTSGLGWSSSIDGPIGSGGSFATTTLSAGIHTITASVTDSHSETGSAAINITVNAPPAVSITAPASGHSVVEGTSIGFTGTATDSEDGDLAANLAWTSSLDGAIGSGGSFSTSTLSIGSHTITASVSDSDGSSNSQDITVIVNANAGPSVTITAPANGSLFQLGDSVGFTGSANDTEDGDLTTSLAWSSSLDGVVGSGGSFSTTTLSIGTHTVTAAVTDSHDETGSAAISVTINEPPVVTITAPVSGHSVVEDTSIGFTGTATDSEDGNIADSLSWVSNLDGVIGSGGSFATSALSIGSHTVTASVTDSDGGEHSANIAVTITANSAPTVSITSPEDSSTHHQDSIISFAGTADDTEDGDLSDGLTWTSNLDGVIGSGGSFSTSLSVGSHTISASATDGHEQSGSDVIALIVDGRPTVSIAAPADGFTVVEATEIEFSGSATDGEDGDLTDSLSWNSNLDGALGNGGNISVVLSIGTHTITASATDSQGQTHSDSIAVTVTANTAPSVEISAPADDALVHEGASIGFAAAATDIEDGDLTDGLSWSSDLDGVFGSGGSFSVPTLSVGTHTITASVADSHSEAGTAFISVTVNGLPTVAITAPADGHTVVEATPVNFAGSASDSEDGDLTGSLVWTSSLDGAIGSGGSFLLSTLSVGTHSIAAGVTDSHGGPRSESVTVNANQIPVVTITSPTTGEIFLEGSSIDFSGTATDSEDGDLSAGLSWSSTLDGAIGSGSAFSAILSVGDHVITAATTDGHGAEASASLSVTVNSAPTISITSPIHGSIFPAGATIVCTGTASDTEDGDVGSSIVWSSDADGILGTGASIATVLSHARHTVTASITDSHGETRTASILVMVNPVIGNMIFEDGFESGNTSAWSDPEE